MNTSPPPAPARRSCLRNLLALAALVVAGCATLTRDTELDQRCLITTGWRTAK